MALRSDLACQPLYPVIVGIAVCLGCACEPPNMAIAPPDEVLYGRWIIDQERTTWHALRDLWKIETAKPEDASLEIAPDGHFAVDAFPDVSFGSQFSDVRHRSGQGTWMIRHPARQAPYMWLVFSEVNGECTEGSEMAFWFVEENNTYYLRATLDAEFDYLVLRKTERIEGESCPSGKRGTREGGKTSGRHWSW